MKVAAVQLNLKNCFSKKQFIDYIEKQVFENLLVMPDIICFPENINYCLLFAKKESNHLLKTLLIDLFLN